MRLASETKGIREVWESYRVGVILGRNLGVKEEEGLMGKSVAIL